MTRRKCSRCNKVRVCRANNKANCKNDTQKLCLKCNASIGHEWYMINREYKCEYQRQYHLGNKRWLNFIRNNLRKLTPDEKLKALKTDDY